MFDLICHVVGNRNYDSRNIHLIQSGNPIKDKCQIPEDANISFELMQDGQFTDQGIPLLSIGDVPVTLTQTEDSLKWVSVFEDPFSKRKDSFGKPLTNNAGVSEFLVTFSNSKKIQRISVDILATKENEVLSREMLDYLSTRFGDVVNLCFSRSMIGAGNADEFTECNISKLIKEAEKGISQLERSWSAFSRTLRTSPEREINIQRGGVPDSPEGLIWLSQNQSNIVFCEPNEKTLQINNLPAMLLDGAVERVNQKANVKENFVILSYLFNLQQKLKYVINKLSSDNQYNTILDNEYLDYVSLDHIISQYREPVIHNLIRKVNNLEKRSVILYKSLAGMMEVSKPPKFYPPEITSFVARNPYYRNIYTVIFNWYKLGDVVFTDTELFHGLRHLTTIYEFTCLALILDSFGKMDYSIEQRSWRDYSVKVFGGMQSKRPINVPNNFFVLSNDNCEIEIYYEPKIWRKKHSKIGDPVVVLAEHAKYEDHHLSPDFLLKIKWKNNRVNDLLIFDAKYSPASSVREHSLNTLINRYFFGIHQIGKDGSLGRLPIQAVWALYPKRGKTIVNSEFYANEHCLSGEMPLLPSLGGINLRPSKQSVFQSQLSLLMKKLMEH